jgi:hypothetical protein
VGSGHRTEKFSRTKGSKRETLYILYVPPKALSTELLGASREMSKLELLSVIYIHTYMHIYI